MEFNEFGEFFGQMPPVLIFNICMVVVLITALLIYFTLVRPINRNRKKRAEEAQAASTPSLDSLTTYSAPPPTPAPYIPPRRTGEYTVKLPDGQPARAVEIVAILRDTADDRLIVQMNETGYRTLVDQPEIKSKFTALMKELAETIARADTPRPFQEPETTAQMPIPPDLDMPNDMDLPDLDTLSTLPPTPVAPPPVVKPPAPRPSTPPAASGSIPGALPNYRDPAANEPKVTSQGLFRAPKVEFQPMPELNLASAIEAYLQHRLSLTPEYRGRDIHVHSAPGGGVVIQVDDTYYEAVGDIADPTIREFVASTIQEWQEQQ